ncbi:hypothetical protein C3L33_06858, partial [Rhododendron williamsianum]
MKTPCSLLIHRLTCSVSFPSVSLSKIGLPSSIISSFDVAFNDNRHRHVSDHIPETRVSTDTAPPKNSYDMSVKHRTYLYKYPQGGDISKGDCSFIEVMRFLDNVWLKLCHSLQSRVMSSLQAHCAFQLKSLPPGIVVSETDLYLRRLWGEPSENADNLRTQEPHFEIQQDLKKKPKYLVTFTVGLDQRNNIDAAVKKFSEDFQILLFHYDGRTSEWDQFEWSQRAVHVSVTKQTKWWYAKRFLHPDIVAAYDYIFIWDEDLGVEHFNAEKYIQLVKKYGLEISQPGLEPNNGLTWQMTKRRGDREVHKFVEIMAPVFSREAWRCVWHMIQPAHEKIGVVDSQWIVHQVIPSLGNQGNTLAAHLFNCFVHVSQDLQGKQEDGKAPWQGVRERCKSEWAQFQKRLADADKAYLSQIGKG